MHSKMQRVKSINLGSLEQQCTLKPRLELKNRTSQNKTLHYCDWVFLVDLFLSISICWARTTARLYSTVVRGVWDHACKAPSWEARKEVPVADFAFSTLHLWINSRMGFHYCEHQKLRCTPSSKHLLFLFPVSVDGNKQYLEVQLGMHNSCLSYLNSASNRAVIVQRNYRGNCEWRAHTVLQLISITVTKLSLLSDI